MYLSWDEIEELKKFECPNPECDGTNLGYIEDVSSHREVLGLDEHGVLLIDGEYSTAGWDDGENARLHCARCGQSFPFHGRGSIDQEIDFV